MKRVSIARWLVVSFFFPVAFQSVADDVEADVEEVIVSATRREESVMDVPMSVQLIPGEKFEKPTYKHVKDVYALVPGAAIASAGGKPPQSEGLQMRGSGALAAQADFTINPVGYYIDDVAYVDINSTTPPQVGTYDLAGIEVLRGAQGTTYGTESSAGAIILRTNPVDLSEFSYKTRVGMMSYMKGADMGMTYGGVLNVPLVEDKLGIRLAYLSEEDPGHAEVEGRPAVDDAMAEDRDSIRAKLTWKPSDAAEITLNHSEWNTTYGFEIGSNLIDSSGGTMIVHPMEKDFTLEKYPSGIPANETEISWSTARAAFDMGPMELSYTYGSVDSARDSDSENRLYGISTLTTQYSDTASHEIRLVSQEPLSLGGITVDYIAGYTSIDAESFSTQFIDGANPDAPNEYTVTRRMQDHSAMYGELGINLTEQITILAGLRSSEDDRLNDTTQTLREPGDPPMGPYTGTVTNSADPVDNFEGDGYRFGVQWRPVENGMIYLTRSKMERAPVLMSLADQQQIINAGFADLASASTAPGEQIATELGAKFTLADGDLEFEVAYAINEWNEIPLLQNLGNWVYATIGGTAGDINSFETMINFNLTDNLSLAYAGSFVDSEITAIPTSAPNYPPVLQVGGELYNYHPNTHAVTANYSTDLQNGWEGYMSGSYTYRSTMNGFESYTHAANTEYSAARSPYKYGNLTVGATKDEWDISMSITNLTDFDEAYLGGSSDSVGGHGAILLYPRALHLTVSYSTM